MIKSASGGMFTYATADRKRSPTDGFDIGASDDACLGIPTSIKTSSGNIVGLSDARAFWASFNHVPYRMLVGSYDQEGDRKFFREIHEILFRDIYKRRILGDVSIGQVTGFDEGLKGFGVGDHERARSWARDRKMEIGKSGLLNSIRKWTPNRNAACNAA